MIKLGKILSMCFHIESKHIEFSIKSATNHSTISKIALPVHMCGYVYHDCVLHPQPSIALGLISGWADT